MCFPKCYWHLGFTRNYGIKIVSLLIFLLCFYVNKHGLYFLVFLYRGLAVMSRLKSSIQLNPERKITSHCNRLPHRKSSSTTPCIASRNNNLAIFRTINPVKKRVLLFEINNVNVMIYIRKNLFFAIWFSKFFNFQFSFEIFQ